MDIAAHKARRMKDSGIEWIGEIPESKNVIRNKYFLSYEKGKLPSETNENGNGKPYIGASDLDDNASYKVFTIDDDLPEAKYDDLLVLWDGARAGLSGRHKEGIISSTIVKVFSKCSEVYNSFLYWYYKGFEQYMYDAVNGTTIPHMNRKYIEDIRFIDWTRDEQQRIANYLDSKCSKIDFIIEKQEAVIEKLQAYKQSLITEAVTKGLDADVEMKDSGIEWIGEIPKHWGIKKFKHLGIARNGLTYSPNDISDESGVLVLRSSNIKDGKMQFDDNVYVSSVIPEVLMVKEGDILICSRNGSRKLIGKNSIIKEKLNATFGAFMMIFRSYENPQYIKYILDSEIFSYYLATFLTSTINQLTNGNFLNMKVVFCDDKEEQQQIVSYLDSKCSSIDASISKKKLLIEKLKTYKKSLIYEVVTGKKEV